MKQFCVLLLFLATFTFAQARQIDEAKAQEIAQSFFMKKGKPARSPRLIHQSDDVKAMQPSLTHVKVAHLPGYYVFAGGESADDKGFVIVAGDDEIKPVIGWSDNAVYDPAHIPVQLQALLDEYDDYLAEFRSGNAVVVESRGGAAVSPLLSVQWNQDAPFNLYTPMGWGWDDHAPTGCVATAMAQVMKYHNYPPKGHGYIEEYGFGTDYLNLDKSIYDWDNMLDRYVPGQYSDEEASAVARLMCDVGYSVNMQYDMYQSSAYDVNVAAALYKHFNYDEAIRYRQRKYYDSQTWIDMIRENLMRGEPVIYGGSSNVGHEFVCDGIDSDDYLHINWGWGGYCDGYFDLNAFTPAGVGIGGGNGNYYREHAMIINIRPGDPAADHSDYIQPPMILGMKIGSREDSKPDFLNMNIANSGSKDISAHTFSLIVDLYDTEKKLFKGNWILEGYPYLLRSHAYSMYNIDVDFKDIPDGDYYISLRYTNDYYNSKFNHPDKYDFVAPLDFACEDFLPVSVKGGKAVIVEQGGLEDNIIIEGIVSTVDIYDVNPNIGLEVDVRNDGVSIVGNCSVSVYCVPEDDWTEDMDISKLKSKGTLYIADLYGGVCRTYSCGLNFPSRISPGNYRLIFAYNGKKIKTETDCKIEILSTPTGVPMVMVKPLSTSHPSLDNHYSSRIQLSWSYYAPKDWQSWYDGKDPLQLWACREDSPEEEFLLCEIEDANLEYDWYSSMGTASAIVYCYPDLYWRAPGEYRMWLKYMIDDEWVVIPGENNLCRFTVTSPRPLSSHIELAGPVEINGGEPVEIGKEFEVKVRFTSPTGIRLSESRSQFSIMQKPDDWNNVYAIDWYPVADKWELAPGESCEIKTKFIFNEDWAQYLNYDLNSLAGKRLIVFPEIIEDYGEDWGSVLVNIHYNEYVESLYFTLSEQAGISDITVDDPALIDYALPYEVYNLSGSLIGQSVDGLNAGVYIVRQGTHAVKFVIK